MAPVTYIAVLLMTLVPGNADLLSRTLLDRLEALEEKDAEQTIRMEQLEKKALDSTGKLNHLSASNNDLQKCFDNQAKKLQDQEDIVLELRKDVEHYKTVAERSKRIMNILQFKVQNMGNKIEKMAKVNANIRENYQEELEEIINMKMKSDEQIDKVNTKTDVSDQETSFRLSSKLTSNTLDENDEHDTNHLSLDEANLAESVLGTENARETDTLNTIASDTSYGHHHTRWNRILLLLTFDGSDPVCITDMTHHSIRSTTTQVAFHAVHLQATIQAPQIKDTVKFEYVYLNQGNGYHDQLSLFIAPQPGLYLFSTTIMSVDNIGHNSVVASIVKNGVRLGNVICTPNERKQSLQSSVTMVTQLNVGDEVWVLFVGPDGGQIWGNGFTSFAGILIM